MYHWSHTPQPCRGILRSGPFAVTAPSSALAVDMGVNGVPGTAMQAFGAQLNDVDMAAVLTFQRNAFGNNMGDIIQPIDVYNFKQGQ